MCIYNLLMYIYNLLMYIYNLLMYNQSYDVLWRWNLLGFSFRIEKLARDVVEDMKDKQRVIALCVLKGGFRFFSDLINKINTISQASDRSLPLSLDFIRLKSYAVSFFFIYRQINFLILTLRLEALVNYF